MRIGIDIDDTMTFIKDDLLKAAIEYDKSLGNDGTFLNDDYYIGKRFNWNKDEYNYFMGEVRKEVVCNAKLRHGLLSCLNQLIEEGNEIIIITARSNIYYKEPLKMTLDWLKKEQIPYQKMIINAKNKAKYCKEENIDIFLDDDVDNCIKVNEAGIKTYIMDNIDNYLDDLKIERIYNFDEFYKSVKKYIQTKN